MLIEFIETRKNREKDCKFSNKNVELSRVTRMIIANLLTGCSHRGRMNRHRIVGTSICLLRQLEIYDCQRNIPFPVAGNLITAIKTFLVS